ncbi:protoporphyrinogen oxidase [Kineosporia babensis]|uniref:Coproporphyrinogen III oxidase n=1 Tax=Kineosporia babensis TaxID=499548 RepID=A0A9X1T3K5_9ACTN|nr:protoporphyrinogen oxidase [Kineosporia babensis]MCD5315748.1 protoporphyrinogen oxidase [Kineosporia babensis]
MADVDEDQDHPRPHVVVVGAGIAGLTAAFALREAPVRLSVLEAGSRLGGKLAVSQIAGVQVDEGAEGLYARRPKTARLVADVGLGEQLTTATTKATAIWTHKALRALPYHQFMGVPSDMDELAGTGLLSPEGIARARQEADLPLRGHETDRDVAGFVGDRYGREVVDQLVDPFLADVCAGRSDELSFQAMLTPLARALKKHPSLTAAAGSLIAPPSPPGQEPPPGLATLTGGMGSLPPALAQEILRTSPGAEIRLETTVESLQRRERGWRLQVSTGGSVQQIEADAVVLALPAEAASKLLSGLPPVSQAAADLADIPYTGTAIITFAYPRQAFPEGIGGHRFCGYRVPAREGYATKAVTFSSVKWRHLAGDLEILRCQIGGVGDQQVLGRDDDELVALAGSELAEATGVDAPPVAARVSRWADSLPQYTVGHLARVERIHASLATQPGLAACGAAFDGVGVGNCIASAFKAAESVQDWMFQEAAARG